MDFMGWIVALLKQLENQFYFAYLEVLSWVYPFWLLAEPLLLISRSFGWVCFYTSELQAWLIWANDKISALFDWEVIWSYILSYVPNLEEIRDWFYYWWDYVTDVILSWWSSTSTIVLGWVDAAKDWAWLWIDYLQDQVSALDVRIDNVLSLIPDVSDIQNWFANWTGNVTTVISAWWTGALLEVQNLINTAFIIRSDFWAGWQEWRDKVTDFFTDPEDWLYKSMDRIVERFW